MSFKYISNFIVSNKSDDFQIIKFWIQKKMYLMHIHKVYEYISIWYIERMGVAAKVSKCDFFPLLKYY